MNEMTVTQTAITARETALIAAMDEQRSIMKAMALQMQAMSDTITKLEREVRMLEKLSPMQVTELNAMVRKQSAKLCEEYGITGKETRVNQYIRAALKAEFGVSSVKEISRCDWTLAKNVVSMWEDSTKLFNLRG